MPTEIVSVPIPFLGDPNLFESEPFIVLAGRPMLVEYSSDKATLRDLYGCILKQNEKLSFMNISLEQKKAVCFAAAFSVKHGHNASIANISRTTKSMFGKEWELLFPLIYASYTNKCIAAKRSEDPVIILKKRFFSVQTEPLKVDGLRRSDLSSYVTDVISHASGRLSVEAAAALRRHSIKDLTAVLNCFSNLVLSFFERDKEYLRLERQLLTIIEKGYKGCAYIPSWEILVKL